MKKTKIIAEIGVNHNGDINIAKKLILEAKRCGADYVKFQTFQTEDLVTKYALKASYQKKNTSFGKSQFEMLQGLQFEKLQFDDLKKYCDKHQIKFLSSPFDIKSIEILSDFNMDFWKIPSGEITNYPFLSKIAETKKPIVLSTGMSYLKEIQDALEIFYDKNYNKEMITVLHCTSEYPCKISDVNLNCIKTLQNKLNVAVGFSDHSEGILAPVSSVILGASIIEKHFTLDKNLTGPDHKASLEPKEFKEMVLQIKNLEKMLIKFEKEPCESEIKNIKIVRKSIVAKVDIAEGEILNEENISTKRPGTGINPMMWNKIIGMKAIKNFQKDQLIEI